MGARTVGVVAACLLASAGGGLAQTIGPPDALSTNAPSPGADGRGAPPGPAGALGRAVFGPTLAQHGLQVQGWGQATVSASGNDTAHLLPAAFFNSRSGVNLNQLGLVFCGDRGCPGNGFGPPQAVVNRVGPAPGDTPRQVQVGFNLTAVYGADGGFFKTSGLDGDFRFDRHHRMKLDVTQAFVDIYLPLFEGTSVLIGSFQTPLGNEIGYPFTPPDWFVSHAYAFAAGPSKHIGVLAETRLVNSPTAGLFGVEFGVVRGWNNWTNRSGEPSFIGALRWRTPDMVTQVDLEAMYGDGDDDFERIPGTGGSQYDAASADGRYLGRLASYLVLTETLSRRMTLVVEGAYGRQAAGDLKVTPTAITVDSPWYGVNANLRYPLRRSLFLNGRAEWFDDVKGANSQWNGARGNVYAATGDIELDLTAAMRLRAELRYDRHEGQGDLFDSNRSNDQVTGILEAFAQF